MTRINFPGPTRRGRKSNKKRRKTWPSRTTSTPSPTRFRPRKSSAWSRSRALLRLPRRPPPRRQHRPNRSRRSRKWSTRRRNGRKRTSMKSFWLTDLFWSPFWVFKDKRRHQRSGHAKFSIISLLNYSLRVILPCPWCLPFQKSFKDFFYDLGDDW